MIVVPDWHYIVKDNFFDQRTHELLLHRFNQIKETFNIEDHEQFIASYTHIFDEDTKKNSLSDRQLANLPTIAIRSNYRNAKVYSNSELETRIIDTLKHLRKYSEPELNNAYSYLKSSLENPKQIIGCTYALVVGGKHFKYQPHIDIYEKALSVIVYIGEDNLGTFLSNEHTTTTCEMNEMNVLKREEILWKSNRAFIFCGSGHKNSNKEDKLIHYYKSNGITPRCTVSINFLR